MAVLRFDLPDLCSCGTCGPVTSGKYIQGPVIEKTTRCGTVLRRVGNYHVGTVALPQVYLNYDKMCDVWYPPGAVEVINADHPIGFNVGIPNSMRGKLRIKVDMIQDCPRRKRKEESYVINLNLDDA